MSEENVGGENEVVIRPVVAADEQRWRELFAAYNHFYGRETQAELARFTWARVHDPGAPVYAIVAETPEQGVVGIANYLTHESTTTLTPVCYLQDLFVDPDARLRGIGGKLIDWLWAETKANNWARLYWNTREDNYRARALYDRYTPHSGFLRYVLANDDS